MRNLEHMKSTSVLAGFALALLSVGAAQNPAAAAESLTGSWGGGGKIVFPSGETERARCRATFYRRAANVYSMNAVCATASVRVEQFAAIRRVGGNVYRGDFYNQEHGIGGSIKITVRGKKLNASLAGGGGSALFSLSR